MWRGRDDAISSRVVVAQDTGSRPTLFPIDSCMLCIIYRRCAHTVYIKRNASRQGALESSVYIYR